MTSFVHEAWHRTRRRTAAAAPINIKRTTASTGRHLLSDVTFTCCVCSAPVTHATCGATSRYASSAHWRMITCRYQTTSLASPSKEQTSSATPYVLPEGPHGELLLRLIRTLPQQLLRPGSASSPQETPAGQGLCRCLSTLHSSMQLARMTGHGQVCFRIMPVCCLLGCLVPWEFLMGAWSIGAPHDTRVLASTFASLRHCGEVCQQEVRWQGAARARPCLVEMLWSKCITSLWLSGYVDIAQHATVRSVTLPTGPYE